MWIDHDNQDEQGDSTVLSTLAPVDQEEMPEHIEQDEQGDQDDQCGQTMITRMSKVIVRCYNQPWHKEIRKSLPENIDEQDEQGDQDDNVDRPW